MSPTPSSIDLRISRSKALRYKKPALSSLEYAFLSQELSAIVDECEEVEWYLSSDPEGSLLNARIGEEDDDQEFRFMFSDLTADAERLQEELNEWSWGLEHGDVSFDDCAVALIGTRTKLVGYDDVEADYFSLSAYDSSLAVSESGKRLMRLTKAQMLSAIGQVMGILFAFLDLRQRYDYLKATMDVIRGENGAIIDTVKQIDEAYEAANAVCFNPFSPQTAKLDALISHLPPQMFVE